MKNNYNTDSSDLICNVVVDKGNSDDPPTLIDTQIIIEGYKGICDANKINRAHISSVTAAEFLCFHTQDTGKVDYYVITSKTHFPALCFLQYKDRRTRKWRLNRNKTDSILIDFSKDYCPYKMFGNRAITSIINERKVANFYLSISHLDKQRQKYLKKQIEYVLDNQMQCHSINENICSISMSLFEKYKIQFNSKKNIKNTINDMLILATAIEKKTSLLTKDKALKAFMAEEYSMEITDDNDELLIDFSSTNCSEAIKNYESKGYINRGWSYSFKKGNF